MNRRALVAPLALLVLLPVSVYVSYHPKLDSLRSGLPMEVRRVPPGAEASYGPATWRLHDVTSTARVRTDKWDATAPPTGAWVVARFSYHLNAAPPNEYWCEVTFTDDQNRRFEIESGTAVAGRPAACSGEERQRPRVGDDFSFTVVALVPKDAAGEVRPRVVIRTEQPDALEFSRPG